MSKTQTRKKRRLQALLAGMVMLAAAAGLVLYAVEDTLVFFVTPSDLKEKPVEDGRRLRLGGLVEEGSVQRDGDGVTIHFRVTDTSQSVPVVYVGVLPDLFREGQGVVTEGVFDQATFKADQVLAKHDENYMPKEVADALKEKGQWKGAEN